MQALQNRGFSSFVTCHNFMKVELSGGLQQLIARQMVILSLPIPQVDPKQCLHSITVSPFLSSQVPQQALMEAAKGNCNIINKCQYSPIYTNSLHASLAHLNSYIIQLIIILFLKQCSDKTKQYYKSHISTLMEQCIIFKGRRAFKVQFRRRCYFCL